VSAAPALRLVTKAAADWRFDADAHRFRWPNTGRPVPQSRVAGAFRARRASLADEMERHARALAQGKLTAAQFEAAMRRSIKTGYIQGTVLGVGGRDRATKGDWGFVGQQLRSEYGFLRKLVDEAAGLSEARLVQRARYYAGSNMANAYVTANIRAAKRDGHNEKRRVGPGDGHSCATCLDEIGRGWVGIDEPGFLLGHRGGTECGSNDRCDIETRRVDKAADDGPSAQEE